nr:putative e3 ubiquitin-protein ligase bah1-like 1 [Quercus suber]
MENRTSSWKTVGMSIVRLSRKYSTPVGAATIYVTLAPLILLNANVILAHDDQKAMVLEGWMLIEYALMNAIAIRKILKKYDIIHGSVNGRKFKSKLRAEHVELLQSPWLIELAAFYLNPNGSDDGGFKEASSNFSCDFNANPPVITLKLPHLIKLEFDLTCVVCLDTVCNPYALSCGHLFCKSCACSSASVFLLEGLRAASP